MENPRSPGDAPGGLERQEIIDALARLRDRPPRSDPSNGGCVVAILAIITLVLMPFIGRGFDLSSGAMLGLGIGLGLVALLGGTFGIFGGALPRGAAVAEAEEAIQELMVEWPDGDPDVIRDSAITILDGSTVSTGPVTVETFDAKEVAIRLGPALNYVLGIERFLLERQEIYPVFTLLEGHGDSWDNSEDDSEDDSWDDSGDDSEL